MIIARLQVKKGSMVRTVGIVDGYVLSGGVCTFSGARHPLL
jgi:hypothetical protein